MYKVLDLFSGVGGLSHGFAKDDNFNIVLANEIDPQMARTYKKNHPKIHMKECNISDLEVGDIGNVELIIGGPPCQAYSTIGKRNDKDPRVNLFQQYHRILKKVKPTMFIYENVTGLLSMKNGQLIKDITTLFESEGYKVFATVLNAADYGVPQHRKRIILVGTKTGHEFIFPEPTHGVEMLPYVTMKEALGDLPLLGNRKLLSEYKSLPIGNYQKMMRQHSGDILTEHYSSNHNSNLIALMNALPQGGGPEDLPDKGFEWLTSKRFGNSYCRLWWNRPSTTITRTFSSPSCARCIHPLEPRGLTTREGARLQSFPDHFQFHGSKGSKNLQIGNAVPVLLGNALKDSVKKHLD